MFKAPHGAHRRVLSFDPRLAIAFGNVLRELRKEQLLAQDQFALDAGVDRSYYGKLERGERQPSLSMLIRIATTFGVAASELVARTETVLRRT